MRPIFQSWTFESVLIDDHGGVVERRPHSGQLAVFDLGHGVQLELAAVPGGGFQMGASAGAEEERPAHRVSLAPFWLARHLVTQAQWQAVMGGQLPCRFRGPDLPVENVAWAEAQRFCERLTRRAGWRFHLPSEAQWEYAGRAGTTTPFAYGPTLTTELANYCGEHAFPAGAPRAVVAGLYRHTTTPAGRFPPNAFGLSDMHGNLWEWTADTWHASYHGAPADGSAWTSGGESQCRVVRGGSWHDVPDACRSAARARFEAAAGDDLVGFRVAAAPA
ncbi:MAG: formylglycine-generating enzyme family protein [Anaerolineales bacterium]|nr:formylglycine-generating enzyme family protein [Anaerolineales bacterium]